MNNQFMQMLNVMGSVKNPQQYFQQQIMRNPQLGQTINQLQNMQKSNNMSNRDFAIQFLKQQGLNEQQISQMANMFGLK